MSGQGLNSCFIHILVWNTSGEEERAPVCKESADKKAERVSDLAWALSGAQSSFVTAKRHGELGIYSDDEEKIQKLRMFIEI